MRRHKKGSYQLTWMKDGTSRWRRRYKNKVYYFPLLPGETKTSSYGRCLAAWKEKRAEVEAMTVSPWDVARDRIRERMETFHNGPDTPEARNNYFLLQAALERIAEHCFAIYAVSR